VYEPNLARDFATAAWPTATGRRHGSARRGWSCADIEAREGGEILTCGVWARVSVDSVNPSQKRFKQFEFKI
jgi:hypothetical protein